MPYFVGVCADLGAARAEILETLASYGARTPSELLNAAQIIAYGLSALDMLQEARTADMSRSMRLRFRGCANNLNRSVQRSERALAMRLADAAPDAVEPIAEPVAAVPDLDVQQAIQPAVHNIAKYRKPLSSGRAAAARPATAVSGSLPAGASQQDRCELQRRNEQMWAGAMMNVLADLGMAAGSA